MEKRFSTPFLTLVLTYYFKEAGMGKETTDIEGRGLDFVEAEFITIKQSTIRAVDGGHVELQQVGALSIDGERVEVTQGAAVLMRGESVSLNQSIVLIAAGSKTDLNFSFAPVAVSSEEMNIGKSAAGIMAANRLNAENSTAI